MKPVEQSVLSRGVCCASLLGLLLLAAWLRWDLYPKTYFADELIPLAVVKHMAGTGTLDTNWEHADWRGDFAGGFYALRQYNFSSYLVAMHGVRTLAHVLGLGALPDLAIYRLASLVCQLLSLWLVFAALASIGHARAGVLAAAFLAVMPQAVVDAHYARAESFVMLLIALLLRLAVADRRFALYQCLSAFLWGVAVACKFSFGPLALLAVLHALFRRRSVGMLFCWVLAFVAGVFVSAPYILLDLPGFLYGIDLLLHQYAPARQAGVWFASAREQCAYLLSFFSWPVLVLLLPAVWWRQVRERCLVVTCVAISVFYLLVFARPGVFFERNLSHLLPLWAVLFGLGVEAVCVRVPGLSAPRPAVLAGVLAVVVLAAPAWLSVRIVQYCFDGGLRLQAWLSAQEQPLLQQWGVDSTYTPRQLWQPAALQAVPAGKLLRLPQHKIAGQQLWEQQVLRAGFEQVARIALPLGDLPYNQLQINHLPPAYLYYRRKDSGAVMEPP